jgi:DNA-binding NtrC family response regulator
MFRMVYILIVDDDSRLTCIMNEWLCEKGHCVSVYNNPRMLLENIGTLDYDIAFVDASIASSKPTQILPDVNDIIKELKECYPDRAIVCMSGQLLPGDKPKFADAFLSKPFRYSYDGRPNCVSLEGTIGRMSGLIEKRRKKLS